MNGIETLIQRLRTDAQAEIDALLDEAKAQADAITADYAQRAEAAAAEILRKGEAAAAQREERMIAMAAMEHRKKLLATKQDMLDKAFDLALDKLCSLPDEEYITLLTKLASAAVSTGTEQLIFSQQDLTRTGKAVVAAVNKTVPNGGLTLSAQTRPIRGGFILNCGEMEVNCSFETLIRLQRGKLSAQAAKVLFT